MCTLFYKQTQGQATLSSVTTICRKKWDCLSYIKLKAWFWELLEAAPSLTAAVEAVARGGPHQQGRLQQGQESCLHGLPAPSCSYPCSCSCSRCRSLWVLSADPLASVRQIVQVNPSGNHCCIIWQHCRLLICSLSFMICCLVWLLCFNTLMPADSMGGGKLVAFAIFPGSPKHFFLK